MLTKQWVSPSHINLIYPNNHIVGVLTLLVGTVMWKTCVTVISVMRVTALLPHPDAKVGALSVQWLVKLFSVFSKATFMHLLTIFVLSLVVSASMSNSTLDNYIVEDCELNFFFFPVAWTCIMEVLLTQKYFIVPSNHLFLCAVLNLPINTLCYW